MIAGRVSNAATGFIPGETNADQNAMIQDDDETVAKNIAMAAIFKILEGANGGNMPAQQVAMLLYAENDQWREIIRNAGGMKRFCNIHSNLFVYGNKYGIDNIWLRKNYEKEMIQDSDASADMNSELSSDGSYKQKDKSDQRKKRTEENEEMSPSTEETIDLNEEAAKTMISDQEEKTEIYEEENEEKAKDPSTTKESLKNGKDLKSEIIKTWRVDTILYLVHSRNMPTDFAKTHVWICCKVRRS